MTTRRKPPTRKATAAPSPLAGLDLVAVLDGPMSGQWFHRADWDARRLAAERMGHDREGDHPAGVVLRYAVQRGVPRVKHPSDPVGLGHAAQWTTP